LIREENGRTTSHPCLTLENWDQLIDLNDPLPSGLGGRIITTVGEGGPLPAIYVSGLDGTNPQKIAVGAWPSLSTDGTRLAYSAADGLHGVDLATGQNNPLGRDGHRLVWSPDDTRILFSTTFNLFVVNADGTGLQKIDTGPAGILSSVGWLPDNQTVVYGALGGNGFTFTTYNLQNGERKGLFTFQNKAGFGAISPDGQWIVFDDKVFGKDNWGIYVSKLDGSQRRLVASWDVPTAFTSVWSPAAANGSGKQWLILNTSSSDGTRIPVLIDPFTCQAVRMRNVNRIVEG
jgi:Tol biopolymer transport system component